MGWWQIVTWLVLIPCLTFFVMMLYGGLTNTNPSNNRKEFFYYLFFFVFFWMLLGLIMAIISGCYTYTRAVFTFPIMMFILAVIFGMATDPHPSSGGQGLTGCFMKFFAILFLLGIPGALLDPWVRNLMGLLIFNALKAFLFYPIAGCDLFLSFRFPK